MNNRLIAAICFLSITACQSGPFKKCTAISLKKSKHPHPVYASSSDQQVAGYIAAAAKIKLASGGESNLQEVSVLHDSKLKGQKVWVDSSHLVCK